jgi:hypothetical protein
MYSLPLMIFVASEKKAFEHFPIWSNLKLSPAVAAIFNFMPKNDHWMVLYKIAIFYTYRKSEMAATAGHRLTLDPMGKYSNAFSETTNMIKAKLYTNVHWMVLYKL